MNSYSHLAQCEGGIFSFPVENVAAIGTAGCLTCVCVYIPIDERRCFAAHISGDYRPSNITWRHIWEQWQLPAEEIEAFKATIRRRLEMTFKSLQKEVQDIRTKKDLQQNAMIVCPWQKVHGTEGIGRYIIEALCEFFHLDRSANVGAREHGFVIRHPVKSEQDIVRLGWNVLPTEDDIDRIAAEADDGDSAGLGERWGAALKRRSLESDRPTGWMQIEPEGQYSTNWGLVFDGAKGQGSWRWVDEKRKQSERPSGRN